MNNEELNQGVAKLNTLYKNLYCQWQWTTARKEHTDRFGVTISRDEDHFTRDTGPRSVDRLSVTSMESLIVLLFYSNIPLNERAEEIVKAREEEQSNAIRNAMTNLLS
jgi:hypothetical protein